MSNYFTVGLVLSVVFALQQFISCQGWSSPVYLSQDPFVSTTNQFAYFFSKTTSSPVQCNVTLTSEYEMYGYGYETFTFSLDSVTANMRYRYTHPQNQYGFASSGSKFSMSCSQASITTQGTNFMYYKPEKPTPVVYSYDYSTSISWNAVNNADYYQFTLKQFPFTNRTMLPSENYGYGFQVYLDSIYSGQYYEYELYSFSGIKSDVFNGSFISYLPSPVFDSYYYEQFDRDAKWSFNGNPMHVQFVLCRQFCYTPQLKQCLQLNASAVYENYQYKYRYNDLENHQCYDFTIQAVSAYANSTIDSYHAITKLKDVSSLNYTYLSYNQTVLSWNDNLNSNLQNISITLSCYSTILYDPNPQSISISKAKSPIVINTTGDTPYQCSLQLCSTLLGNYDCTWGEMGGSAIHFRTPPGAVKNIIAYCTTTTTICLYWDSFEGSTFFEIVEPTQTAPVQVDNMSSYTALNLIDSTKYRFKLTAFGKGFYAPSVYFEYHTKPRAPSNVMQVFQNATAIAISWSMIGTSGPYMYKVCSCDLAYWWCTPFCVTSNSSSYIYWTDVNTDYQTQLYLYNIDRIGLISSAQVFYGLAYNSLNLKTLAVQIHSLRFYWENTNRGVYKYSLLQGNTEMFGGSFNNPTFRNITQLFSNLPSNTKYEYVVTVSNYGVSFNTSVAVTTKVKSPLGITASLEQPLVAMITPTFGENITDVPVSGFRIYGYPYNGFSDFVVMYRNITQFFASVMPSSSYLLKMYSLNQDKVQSDNFVTTSLLVPTVLPPYVSIVNASGSKVSFALNDTNYGGNIAYSYTACIEGSTICEQVNTVTSLKTLNATISNLQPATVYNATFYAKNIHNISESIVVPCFTGVAPPTNVTTDLVGSNFIFLNWIEGAPLLSESVTYIFTYTLISGGMEPKAFSCTSSRSSKCTRVSLFGLSRVSRYSFTITARASYNGIFIDSGLQTIGEFTTVQGAPPSKAPEFSHEILDTTILITFEKLSIEEARTSEDVYYYIEYTTDNQFETSSLLHQAETGEKFVSFSILNSNEEAPTLFLNNLQPATQYLLRAYARTDSGSSSMGTPKIIVTGGVPATIDSGAVAGALTSVFLIIFICLVLVCIIGFTIAIIVTIVIMKKARRNKQFTASELLFNGELYDMDTNFKINYKDLSFSDSKVLGSGAQGTVCSAKYKEALVAVKLFPKSVMGVESDMQDFLTELKFLAKHCHHSNIIRFIGVAEDFSTNTLCLITELYSGGNLATFIEKNSISFAQKVSLLRGIASGMSFLHNNNIVHRDLKCENVLLDGDIPKIIDFGLSRQLENTNKTLNLTMNVGTATYLAPEVIKLNVNSQLAMNRQVSNAGTVGEGSIIDHSQSINEEAVKKKLRYDCKADVYSFAILMFVVYFRNRNPYGTNVTELQLLYYISQNSDYRPKYNESAVSKEEIWYIELMKQCWATNPDSRPSFEQIIEQIDSHL